MQSCSPVAAAAGAALLTACAALPGSGAGGARAFDVVHAVEIEVPEGAETLRAWIAAPDPADPAQRVDDLDVALSAPVGASIQAHETTDGRGNRFLYVEARDAGGGTVGVETSFALTRWPVSRSTDPDDTRPLTPAERVELAPYLAESTHVRATPEIRARALEVVGDERNPTRQARLLYDWVLDHVQYWVKDPSRWSSSGVGSSAYTFEECTGNCTDFHSLYSAAAVAVGLPTRMVYGSFFKGPLDGVERDQSYHCWVEYFAPEVGWVPLDVAVADVFVDDFNVDEANASKVDLTVADGYAGPDPGLVEFYFGNLEARRVTWHRGRDLVPEPRPAAAPLNALPKAHVEADGRPVDAWTRVLTFREVR